MRTKVRTRLLKFTMAMEIVMAITILGAILASIALLICGSVEKFCCQWESFSIDAFMANAFLIVMGIEFVKMLMLHTYGAVIDVLLFAIARGESASGDLLRIGVPALRIISYSFLFAGYCIVATAVFQALGHGVLSLVVSVVRQLFVLLPVAFLLSRVGVLDWVWWAFPIAELVAVVLCTVFLRHVYHKEIAPPAGEREAA